MSNVNIVTENKVETIVNGVTSTGTQPYVRKPAPGTVFQVVLTGTGAISATIYFEVSLDGTNWVSPGMATVSLSGTNSVTDGFASNAPWRFVRVNINALSGTGASVTVYMGY